MIAFHPPALLKNRHLQSIFASTGPRRLLVMHRARELLACSTTILLDGGATTTEQHIRLQGELSAHPHSRGIVILLHGWEGSANSLYLLSAGAALFAAGYSVFRLNLRDHGPTHHLNRELFNSTRVDEVVHALRDLQQQLGSNQAYFLTGFSLGGNFGLRIALQAQISKQQCAIEQQQLVINKVIAICPVINPAKTTRTLSEGWWVYHNYFVHKWQKSLAKKLAHFPELGYGEILLKLKTLEQMNQYFVPKFTPYATTTDYFAGYAIDKTTLNALTIPSHLIASADDPVIAINDLQDMYRPDTLTVEIHQHGGHCGFIKNYRLDSWIDQRIVELINEANV